MEWTHKPVLLDEVVNFLSCVPGGFYCDGTVGLGGHAEGILEATAPRGRLIGIDLDALALAKAKERLARFGDRVILIKGNFKDLPSILESYHIPALDGVLLDLGLSSYQLECEKRGFSFLNEAPLIMNFDLDGSRDAAEIVNKYSEAELAEIIWKYGQQRWSRKIARKIVEERKKSPLVTTSQLVKVIHSIIPSSLKKRRIHPATKTFQALRIEVNNELENLAQFLKVVWTSLRHGGRICIISYHSLEDGLVKNHFRYLSKNQNKTLKGDVLNIITKKPIRPSIEEIKNNPRSRSAKMRVAEWG